MTDIDIQGQIDSLTQYLEATGNYTGFDFNGTNFQALINLLSKQGHDLSRYAEMAHNESRRDTAILRHSLAAIGEERGYLTKNYRASRGLVDVDATFTTQKSPNGFILLPRGTVFKSNSTGSDNRDYLTITDHVLPVTDPVAGIYSKDNIEILQGSLEVEDFLVDDPQLDRYFIRDEFIDVQTVTVRVWDSVALTTSEDYLLVQDYMSVKIGDPVFFLSYAGENGYEVIFGSSSFGKALTPGQVIEVEYLSTTGEDGNYGKDFSLTSPVVNYIGHDYNLAVTTTAQSSAGSGPDSIEEMREAIRGFNLASGRLFTPEDIKTRILDEFPDIDAIRVYDGEENDIFGTIFISIKPINRNILSDSQKEYIREEILNPRTLPFVDIVFVDPQIITVDLDIDVFYSPAKTSKSDVALSSDIVGVIDNYESDDLQRFDSPLKLNTLFCNIEDSNSSIFGVSGKTLLSMTSQSIIPGVATNDSFGFNVEIRKGSVISTNTSIFIYNGNFIDQDGVIVFRIDTGEILENETFGTVDYTTGDVKFTSINITGNPLTISANPLGQVIDTLANKIFTIGQKDISLIPRR